MTPAITADGWSRPADIGYPDEGGFLFVAARRKDIVIHGVETIGRRKVLAALHPHPASAEVSP